MPALAGWMPRPGKPIPPITTAQGNYTRFGCKTNGFRLPGFFGPNGHFGGFVGGQCCASRSNNLNPLSGPNGLEVSGGRKFHVRRERKLRSSWFSTWSR